MGLGDMVNKAKDVATEHSDKVTNALDTASEKIKERTGDDTDAKIDTGVTKAKDYLREQGTSRGRGGPTDADVRTPDVDHLP